MTRPYPEIDAFDRKIIDIMQRNNRLSHREVSEMVCLSVPAVARRLARLRAEGVITADTSVVCPEYVGVPLTLIVEVTVENAAVDQIVILRDRLLACPNVQQCYDVTGPVDFIVIMLVRDMLEFEGLKQSLFQESGNIRRLHTFVALQRLRATLSVPIAQN